MGKRFLLSAIAVGVIASVASAGVVKNMPADTNISVEFLQQQDLNGSNPTVSVLLNNDKNSTVYVPSTITLGTLKNPILNLRFSGLKATLTNPVSVNNNLVVCEVNSSNQPVAQILRFKDTTSNGFTLAAVNSNIYMSNSKQYGFFIDTNASDTNCSQAIPVSINDVNITLDPKADQKLNGLTVTYVLGTGDTQKVQDTASASIGNIGYELCCNVNPMSTKIDPQNGFLTFTSNGGAVCGGGDTESDLTIQCEDKSSYSYTMSSVDIYSIINYDSDDLPLEKVEATGFDMAAIPSDQIDVNKTSKKIIVKEKDFTFVPGIYSETIKLYVNGKDKIPVTNFTATLGLDLTQNGTVDIKKLDNVNAGNWTYNGTTLTSPYVAVNANTQTVFRINNASDIDAQTYWTCVDDNGNKVKLLQVNAYDSNSSMIKANGAEAWLAKDILAAAQAQNPDFAPNGKMRCSVLVTTSGTNNASGVEIMTINGARDRVIPFNRRD